MSGFAAPCLWGFLAVGKEWGKSPPALESVFNVYRGHTSMVGHGGGGTPEANVSKNRVRTGDILCRTARLPGILPQ